MTKLSKTQIALLKQAHAHEGRVYFQTYTQRRGRLRLSTVGGRELRAADALQAQGLLALHQTMHNATYVRGSMGYRQERWTDHHFILTDAGREAIAALQEASRR